jgi:Fur family ferric uptake transcriptional regulator
VRVAAENMMNAQRNHESTWQEESVAPRGLAERLRRVGQRVTPQRLVILGALHPGEHISADDVFARVAPQLPGVNRSTVYRTLERFRDLGLVSMTDLGGGARQFELFGERHHHLVCHRCGIQLELDDELLDPLREGIRTRYGFVPAIDHLALFGFCAECERVADTELELLDDDE